MKVIPRALAAAYEFAWKTGIIVIAVAVLAAVAPRGVDEKSTDLTERDFSQRIVMMDGSTAERVVKPADGQCSAFCRLVDEDGRRLLEAAYDRYGLLVVRWGDAFPVRSTCAISREGRFDLVVEAERRDYRMVVDSRGGSGLRITDHATGEVRGLGLANPGEAASEPPPFGSAGGLGLVPTQPPADGLAPAGSIPDRPESP